MGQKLVVVVTGGTGKQGGAVVKSLLERGHKVRAVTRDTDSAKARELANAGVMLVRASLEDTAALTKALKGATSLFAMTTPLASWVCPLLEARTPLGRLGQPDDITPVAVFPASAASSWMTGEMIAVAGGFS